MFFQTIRQCLIGTTIRDGEHGMSEFYADWEKMNTVTDELDNILKDMN